MLIAVRMIQLKGDKKLKDSLSGLDNKLSDSLLRKANKKAVVPLVNEIHKRAPVGLTGDLADSIGTVDAPKENRQLGAIQAGARRKGGHKGFAAHLNEFGTKRRRVKKRHPVFGFDRGKMPAKPFIEPSWENKKDEVLGKITKELEMQVTNYFKRTVPK